MNNKFLSRFDDDDLRRKIIYTVIIVLTVPLLTIPPLKGYSTAGQNLMFFGGIALIFYALLHLLKKALYYVILGECIIIIFDSYVISEI